MDRLHRRLLIRVPETQLTFDHTYNETLFIGAVRAGNKDASATSNS
jgi:hypothetical protein